MIYDSNRASLEDNVVVNIAKADIAWIDGKEEDSNFIIIASKDISAYNMDVTT